MGRKSFRQRITRKKMIFRLSLAGAVLLSQFVLFWGLDVLSKQMLLPNIVFEQPYQLHGETGDLRGEFALSANSRYLAWINSGILYVEDLVLHQRCDVGEIEADLFVWLPDRNSLVFLSDKQLFSLSFEGETRLSRETEANLLEAEYTYSHIAVSTYANLIYLMGTGADGGQDVVGIDLSKELKWLKRIPGASYSRLSVSNKSGVVMLQAETSEGPSLFLWQGPVSLEADPIIPASPAGQNMMEILLGADERGFYVGRMEKDEPSEGFSLKTLLFYDVDTLGNLVPEPAVLWQGDIQAASKLMPFAVGVGLLVTPAGEKQEPYLLKMIWGANHQIGTMEKHTLKMSLPQEKGNQNVEHIVFAGNGLTYLEIKVDKYCWHLL